MLLWVPAHCHSGQLLFFSYPRVAKSKRFLNKAVEDYCSHIECRVTSGTILTMRAFCTLYSQLFPVTWLQRLKVEVGFRAKV